MQQEIAQVLKLGDSGVNSHLYNSLTCVFAKYLKASEPQHLCFLNG